MRQVSEQQNGTFMQKKNHVFAKKLQKIGFFGVFSTALKRFAISLSDSDDARTHKIAAQLDE